MYLKCETCGQPFERESSKGSHLIPAVCTSSCFEKYLHEQVRLVIARKKLGLCPSILDGHEYIKRVHNGLKINQIKPRSRYETVVANWLREHGFDFAFEHYLLNNEYLPDFALYPIPIFLEVKGLWLGRGYSKVARNYAMLEEYGGMLMVINKDMVNVLKRRRRGDEIPKA